MRFFRAILADPYTVIILIIVALGVLAGSGPGDF